MPSGRKDNEGNLFGMGPLAQPIQEHAMLSDFTPSATISVKSLEAVRSFYEGILGVKNHACYARL